MLKTFWKISQPRVICFLHRFLCWNHEIGTIVLSTIKGTNGVKELWKFCQWMSKIDPKPKIAENPDLIGWKGFSLRYLWPLTELNPVKYPRQQDCCSPVLFKTGVEYFPSLLISAHLLLSCVCCNLIILITGQIRWADSKKVIKAQHILSLY